MRGGTLVLPVDQLSLLSQCVCGLLASTARGDQR